MSPVIQVSISCKPKVHYCVYSRPQIHRMNLVWNFTFNISNVHLILSFHPRLCLPNNGFPSDCRSKLKSSWNVMAHAQKTDFVFRRNERLHLNRRGCQFIRLLAAVLCASAVVMQDTPFSEVVWRTLATHSIRQFPLYFPSCASPCAITFQLKSTTKKDKKKQHTRVPGPLSDRRAPVICTSFYTPIPFPTALARK